MRLRNLLEETARQAFLDFQQRLVDLDDGFEQADPLVTGGEGSGLGRIIYHFVRPDAHKTHKVRFIDLSCYTHQDAVEDYKIAVFARGPGEAHRGTRISKGKVIFSKAVPTLDEVMIYLDRVLNAKT